MSFQLQWIILCAIVIVGFWWVGQPIREAKKDLEKLEKKLKQRFDDG